MTIAYRALLIEDNPGDARLVREMLAELLAGGPGALLELDNAPSLAEALKHLAHEDYDAMLVDLGLPDSAGLDTFRRLHSAAPGLPAIVITASDDVNLAISAAQAGAQDYMVKSQISGAPLAHAVQYAIERKRGDEALRRVTRLYAVLSLVNQAVVRAQTVQELYSKVCDIAVRTGKLKMAWIGTLDGSNELMPAAIAGDDAGYVASQGATVDLSPRGMGPTGRAIREGKPEVCNDWALDVRMNPWRAAGLEHGFRSSAAFPLTINNVAIGAMTLYADEIDFFTSDEVQLLVTLTNDVVFAVESIESDQQRRTAEASLRQLNAELEQRVQSRTAELTAVNGELEAFTYAVSHDLRAPLRAIVAFSRIVAESTTESVSETTRDYLERIGAATTRMSDLIDALLSLSRIVSQETHAGDVDLSAMARSVADELRESDRSRRVEFVISGGIHAGADGPLMRVVLQNLLSNAWKFTSKQSTARIEFGAAEEARGTVYFVRDDGVGFDSQHSEKLFAAFQRLHSSAEFEGTGIGLATVQRVISRHGGTVWAEGAPDCGATIYFTLGGAPS